MASDGLVATVSAYTLLTSQSTLGIPPVPMLKRAAILCDSIYVDTAGLGVPGGKWERTYLNLMLGGRDEGHDLLADRRFLELLRRPVDWGDTEAAKMREAQAAIDFGPLYEIALDVVQSLPEEMLVERAPPSRGVDYKVRGSLSIELAEDLYRPDALRPWFPSAVGIVTPLHTRVLRQMGRRAPDDAFPGLVELAEAGVVDYGRLPWREVLRLRESDFIDEFRGRLSELRMQPDGSVMKAMWTDLWEFARENEPAPMKTAIGGILGNIPVPIPVNPYSVGDAVGSFIRARRMREAFGWLFFVMETPTAAVPDR